MVELVETTTFSVALITFGTTPNAIIKINFMHYQLKFELNMPVITEGAETKEHVDFLKEMGTDYYKGFYFDKPLAVEDFEKKYVK